MTPRSDTMRVVASLGVAVFLVACSSPVSPPRDATAEPSADVAKGLDGPADDAPPDDATADEPVEGAAVDRLLADVRDAWAPPYRPLVPDAGACDDSHRCPSGTCLSGRCYCLSGLICAGACVEFGDARHCGGCDRACAPPFTACTNDECVCPAGTCGPSCTSVIDDDLNCGACGVRCLDGERCEGDRCVDTSCRPGTADCEDPAAPCETDLSRSDAHCGACGAACAGGTRCVAGRCVSTGVRPRAPGSMLTATSARPWFRWERAADVDGVRLQVCADAACARRELEADVAGDRFRPTDPLPVGVHFWRAFARRGSTVDATPGPLWAFAVPPPTDLRPSTRGPLPDFDGDGVSDELLWEPVPWRMYGFRLRYGVGADGARRPDLVFTGERDFAAARYGEGTVFVVPTGDLDGDGVADALVALPYVIRGGPAASGALRIVEVRGNRLGAPTFPSVYDVRNVSLPGPILAGGCALGNGVGLSGSFLLVGNPPFCSSVFHPPVPGATLGSEFACDSSRVVSGDFDADGRAEILFDATRLRLVDARAPASTFQVCADVPGFRDDFARRVSVVDVDVDGYDDLVVALSTGRTHVIHGGSGGLDGTRCSVR